MCACVFVLTEDTHCAKQQRKVSTSFDICAGQRMSNVMLHVHTGAEVGSD